MECDYESMTEALRNRIWNVFYSFEIQDGGLNSKRISLAFIGKRTIEMEIADKLGFMLESSSRKSPQNLIKNHILNSEWFKVYDFIEIHLLCLDNEERSKREKQYNEILEDEKVGYRIIDCEVTPITDKEEICEIEKAISSPFDAVSHHLKKALTLYSDLEAPDYENSIKESISAVESMCSIITESNNETLGDALKQLENRGVVIHAAMKKAFSQLYGYTSDECGIRHGKMDFKKAPEEDARYMLISCSAFVNYLKAKWSNKDKTEKSISN